MWDALTAGGFFTCATRTDATAYCWGEGTNGKLGTGYAWRASPTMLP
jgi:hypothetical protein